jgi:hypothetical protein
LQSSVAIENQGDEMHLDKFSIALAALVVLAAGCNKGPDNSTRAGTPPPPQAQVNTPTTPANIGQPNSQEEKKEGANPVQGQIDPKAPEQHRDFRQPGDQKGPTGPDTQPKRGG